MFHSRAMKQALYQKFGRVCPTIKPVVLQALYRELTNDSSAPNTLNKVDKRTKLVLETEDPNIVVDLRYLNTGSKRKYDVFWEECQRFLQEGIGAAIDDRQHHTWLLQYQYLTFSSKLKSDVQMELTYPQYHGLDYNFGQIQVMHDLKSIILEN